MYAPLEAETAVCWVSYLSGNTRTDNSFSVVHMVDGASDCERILPPFVDVQSLRITIIDCSQVGKTSDGLSSDNQISVCLHGVEIKAGLALQHNEIDEVCATHSSIRINTDGGVAAAFRLLHEIGQDRGAGEANQ